MWWKEYERLFFWGLSGAALDENMLVSFLSVDLNCLREHMDYFLSFVDAIVDEVTGE